MKIVSVPTRVPVIRYQRWSLLRSKVQEVWLLEDHSVVRLLCAFVVRSLNLVLCYFNEIFSDMNY